MKHKKLLVTFAVVLFSFVTLGKNNYIMAKVDETKTQLVRGLMKAVDDTLDDTEDPDEVFRRSIDGYQNEFSEYLNIAGLNVWDKEAISLPEFDINYVAPDFSQVMHDYQSDLEASLSTTQLQNYESLRRQDYSFDRYVTLNQSFYRNLGIELKYNHTIKPNNPLNPITPSNPKVNPGGGSIARVAAAATAGIVAILTEAGLGEAVITAFTSCISTMTIGLSTSWIPFVGWALAVALVVGALIALTVIIVENWSAICEKMDEIKAWFMEQFSAFSAFIDTYFGDAATKGEESKVAKRIEVGGQKLEFIDTIITQDIVKSITDDCKRNKKIKLMAHIGKPNNEKGKHWWMCYAKVDEEFVINNKLYDLGVCTYTWYNNIAKRMMAEGSNRINGNYKLLIYDKTINQHDVYGWNHYHLGEKDGDKVKRIEQKPYKFAHSLFGLLYINTDGNYTTYPVNP